jgi:hypothetical protein
MGSNEKPVHPSKPLERTEGGLNPFGGFFRLCFGLISRLTARALPMLFLTSWQSLFGVTQVVGHLQVHPEFRGRFEERPKADRRVSPVIRLSSFRIAVIPLGGTPIRLRERV